MNWIVIAAIVVLAYLTYTMMPNGKDHSKPDLSILDEDKELKTAVFAGGCFWCTEAAFEMVPGVVEAVAGYTGGTVKNPTYEQVSSGKTGHYEAVKVYYNPDKLGFERLVNLFFQSIDPEDGGGQFADRGTQYLTAAFYDNEQEKKVIEKVKSELVNSGKFDKIATETIPRSTFYPAEEYHQDYHKKNSASYKIYKRASGRSGYLEKK